MFLGRSTKVRRARSFAVRGAQRSASDTYNAASPVSVATYDGSNECVHPSVIDFLTQHGLSTWNGHRYWMAMTPFPGSDAYYENPSIVVSDDGLTWAAPAGLTNPIDGPPTPEELEGTTAYYSDTEIVYDVENDRLICYYRYFQNNAADRYRQFYRTSSDGVIWSDRTEYAAGNAGWFISPSVVKVDDGLWYSWDVENAGAPNTVRRRVSSDGLAWPATDWRLCSFVGFPATSEPWHISVTRTAGGWFLMFLNSNLSFDPTPTGNALQLATSWDGLTWHASEVLIPLGSSGAWDDKRIYRASGYIEGSVVRVWYSGTQDLGEVWRIGYTEIPVAELLPAAP